MTMVERVARRIQEATRYLDDGMMHMPNHMAELAARAAIEAMRLPEGYGDPMCRVTEAVQTEVDIWPEDKPRPAPNHVQFVSRYEAVSIWNAGIDAALSPSPPITDGGEE